MAKNKDKKPEAVEAKAEATLDEVKAELTELQEVDAEEVKAETTEDTEVTEVVTEGLVEGQKYEGGPIRVRGRDRRARTEAPAKPRDRVVPEYKGRTSLSPKVKMGIKAEKGVHANPAFLEWPSDKWGLTKDLKAALIQVASRVAGTEDKKALVDAVLRVGVGHLVAKYNLDKAKRDEQMAKAREAAEQK